MCCVITVHVRSGAEWRMTISSCSKCASLFVRVFLFPSLFET